MSPARLNTLGSWSAEGTTVAEVDRALSQLRAAEQRAAVRTAVVTLVAVVTGGNEEAAEAVEVLHELGGRHPSRSLVLVADATGAEAGLDAEVRVHALERDGRVVCFEDIVLRTRGPVLGHLDSVVEPFALADLPVVLWYPRGRPRLDDPILNVADRVIVDQRALAGAGGFRELVALAERLPVADLSWVRLQPWRELFAGLFEGAAFRPFADGVRSAVVRARAGPRHLLAGWLLSRLHLPRAELHLEDAPFASLEVVAEHAGQQGRFAVTRRGDERIVEAEVDIEGGPSNRRTLRLRERSPARVLGQALGIVGHDDVYEQALAAAATLRG